MSNFDCIIQMVGGLGNQMFQYALGRRLQIDRGARVRFDLSIYQQTTERVLTLSKYRCRFAGLSGRDQTTMRLSFGRTVSNFSPLLGPLKKQLLWQVHEDPKKGFDPQVLELHGRWYLRGWWQCPAYFDNLRALLLEEFEPAEPLEPSDAELVRQVSDVNSVCLHIRRGDLITNPLYNREQQVQTAEYYSQCLREMCDRVENPHIFVFSDDFAWARENITADVPVTFMDQHDGASDYVDLHVMSRCKHFIIANSTFSWWGAWLSRNPEKIVIVPPVWRFIHNGPPPDLIPAGWEIGPVDERRAAEAGAAR